MEYTKLTEAIRQHLIPEFDKAEKEGFLYHNLSHTEGVVAAVTEIADHYRLDGKDRFIVTAAAWFHDAGYFADYTKHEEKGAEKATYFLRSNGVDETTITAIAGCILATQMPQRPTNRLEEIVCDADLFHLGTDDFPKKNKLMRKEASLKKNKNFTKAEWRHLTIGLLESHHYFTDYCRSLLNDTKQQHLERLKKKAAEEAEAILALSAETVASATKHTETSKETIEDKTAQTAKNTRPNRGIETMFRITSNNNQRLSDMADNKAQIMITVNSIILSAIISLLLRKLEDNLYLAIPTYIILTVSVLTIIFSILATRPSLPRGSFTDQQIKEKKVNLLFFGNFYKMDLDQYAQGMREVMNDREFLYGTLIRDVYSQGVVLGRKYRLLRISYNIFMFGIIISVLAFVIASIAGR